MRKAKRRRQRHSFERQGNGWRNHKNSRPLDGNPRFKACWKRTRQAFASWQNTSQKGNRPGWSRKKSKRRNPALKSGHSGPQAPHRLFLVFGTHGRRQNRACKISCRSAFWRRACAYKNRYERVYGKIQRVASYRCAARIRRLWRGRSAYRGCKKKTLCRSAFRWGRKGPPRCL